MGISGLLPFLKDASKQCHIQEFRGCTVAIDAYCWLHKGAYACADKLVRGEETFIHINYCLKLIQFLQLFDIKPIMVFDGQHLPAKKETEIKRIEQRKAARKLSRELLAVGKVKEAKKHFCRCVDITHKMALTLIKECRNRNIDCIVAPYEADAQLAYLSIQNMVDIVITEDSDLILFGCSKVLYKLNVDGTAILIEQNNLNKAMKMKPDQYTFDKFRYMCIMSGCDYLDSLPGIGLKRAHRAITLTYDPNVYKLLPRLPRYLNLQKLTVSEKYIENFKVADATIKHQVVFDPINRKLLYLTDPSTYGTDLKYLINAGEILDNTKALQIALGNVDPIHMTVVDNWNPDSPDSYSLNNSKSIWSKTYKKIECRQKRLIVNKMNNIKVATENLTVTQKEKENYDKKLLEELKIYEITEPPLKRPKIINEPKESLKKIVNSFCKENQTKRLSKFNRTIIDNGIPIKSIYFKTCINDVQSTETKDLEASNVSATTNFESDLFDNSISNRNISEPSLEKNKDDTDIDIDVSIDRSQSPILSTFKSFMSYKKEMESYNHKTKKSFRHVKLLDKLQNQDFSDLENVIPKTDSKSSINSNCDQNAIEIISNKVPAVEKVRGKKSQSSFNNVLTSCKTIKSNKITKQLKISSMFNKMNC